MPGDELTEAKEMESQNKKVVLGPGLRKVGDAVVACKAGFKKFTKPSTFWINSYQKRYIPVRGDCVIGIVTAKSGDIFRVDIGSHEPASLSYLAFEGATKKNRPDVNVGDLIYGKLLVASKDLEAELVCVDSHGKKGILGVLTDGFMFTCSINLTRRILKEKCPLFINLQRETPFEIAAGMNGRIWVKSKTLKDTIAVANAILATEFTPDEDISNVCEDIGNKLFNY